MTMIHVGNLSERTDAARLRTLFECHGPIAFLWITPSDPARDVGGFGLVEMDESSARKAIEEFDGRPLDGAILSVCEAEGPFVPTVEAVAPPPKAEPAPPRGGVRRDYEVIEMEKVRGPNGAAGDDWYRYVLACNASRITGFHRGTLEEVTEYATGCASGITARSGRWTAPAHMFARNRKK